jgi:tRNA dimethylallyltransferase
LPSQKTIYIICGPTAVGKTSFAIKLAKALDTEIISADSRQCYRELNIGVAKPSVEELLSVPHHFINSHGIKDEVNAGAFEKYALESAAKIFWEKDSAVMVGGTGLYIKAFCEGMDEIPVADPDIRHQITLAYQEKGIEFLQKELAEKDPLFWQNAEQQNPQRLMRALEVLLSTGTSITSFQRGIKTRRAFNIKKIGLELPREQLYNQINTRVDKMIAEGLVNEVTALKEYKNINSLQTVGYKELFEYVDGRISLEQAITEVKTNTRHYAKRQMTWFRKDEEIEWFNANQVSIGDIVG